MSCRRRRPTSAAPLRPAAAATPPRELAAAAYLRRLLRSERDREEIEKRDETGGKKREESSESDKVLEGPTMCVDRIDHELCCLLPTVKPTLGSCRRDLGAEPHGGTEAVCAGRTVGSPAPGCSSLTPAANDVEFEVNFAIADFIMSNNYFSVFMFHYNFYNIFFMLVLYH